MKKSGDNLFTSFLLVECAPAQSAVAPSLQRGGRRAAASVPGRVGGEEQDKGDAVGQAPGQRGVRIGEVLGLAPEQAAGAGNQDGGGAGGIQEQGFALRKGFKPRCLISSPGDAGCSQVAIPRKYQRS